MAQENIQSDLHEDRVFPPPAALQKHATLKAAELQRMHAVTWAGPAGTFRQATDPAKSQRDIYTALSLDLPKKIIAIEPAMPPAP